MKLFDIAEYSGLVNLHKKAQEKLYEGLITSWPLTIATQKVKQRGYKVMPKENDADFRQAGVKVLGMDVPFAQGFAVFIDPIDHNDANQEYTNLEKLINTAGYYIAYYSLLEKKNSTKYYDVLSDKFASDSKSSIIDWLKTDTKRYAIALHCEAKYDIEIDFNDFKQKTPFLYHATPKIHWPKISKIGLSPRNNDKLTHHPGRIYFSIDPNIAKDLAPVLALHSKHDDFIILEVKTSMMPSSTRLFFDQNFFPYGVFTMSNVSPNAITLLAGNGTMT